MTEDSAAPLDNEQAFYMLLERMKDNNLADRVQGTNFEDLMLEFLSQSDAYQGVFDKVQTYKDWALEHPELELNAKDIGIDLVGSKTMGGGKQFYSYSV